MAWSPGHRRVPPGLSKQVGQHMIALGMIEKFTIRVFGNKPSKPTDVDIDDETPLESGDDVVLSIERANRRMGLSLSNLTTEELDALKETFDIAFEEARLVTLARDKTAEEAMKNGDAIFYRSLRGAPKVSVFRRSERAHDEGVHDGHQDDVAGAESTHEHQPE